MNGDLAPAVIAASGGSAMLAAIAVYEHGRQEQMRASRVRLGLRLPQGFTPQQVEAALGGLTGLPRGDEVVFELLAECQKVAFALWVPEEVQDSVAASLSAALPGLRTSQSQAPEGSVRLASRLFLPTPLVLHDSDPEAASRAFAGGLTQLQEGERVVVRWALRPLPPRPWVPRQHTPEATASERIWRRETGRPGLRAAGLVLVTAGSAARAGQLAGHVEQVTSSRRGPLGRIRATRSRGSRSFGSMPRTTRTSGWVSARALVPLLGWPVGEEAVPGVEVGASRELLVPRELARRGRQLLIGRDVGGEERPVALDPVAARHHLAVAGPSGGGKSVVLTRGVLSDLEHGYGGAVLDPKGDLIRTILERVPEAHADRVVVLDPAEPVVPGVDVLGAGDPDLRSDVIVGALAAIFKDNWGVRSDYFGHLGLRTLSEVPGATLADLGRLFTDAAYRQAAIARLRDPLLIGAWQSYAALSPAAQAEHVEAPMNRVIGLLARPAVRAVLASPTPKLDIGRLFAERRFLLVSLSPGTLGEPASRLLGAILLYVVWAAIEERAFLAPERRRPIFLYIDELATIAGLPFGFELLAERARGLGAGLTVALQTFGRLPESVRAALLGNVGSLVTFRAAADEAHRLARELPGLTAGDLQALGRFEVAARVATGAGSAGRVVTGRTEPLPEPTGQARIIRERSAGRYGTSRKQLDAPREQPTRRPQPGRARRQR